VKGDWDAASQLIFALYQLSTHLERRAPRWCGDPVICLGNLGHDWEYWDESFRLVMEDVYFRRVLDSSIHLCAAFSSLLSATASSMCAISPSLPAIAASSVPPVPKCHQDTKFPSSLLEEFLTTYLAPRNLTKSALFQLLFPPYTTT
jgi:hypothetical protein